MSDPRLHTFLSIELPRDTPDAPAEGLALAMDTTTGELVVQLALRDERWQEFEYERPCSIPLPPDAALRLAYGILAQVDPEGARAVYQHHERGAADLVSTHAQGGIQ